MRLTLFFSVTLPPMRDVADNSLAAFVHRDVLHRDVLLAARAVFLRASTWAANVLVSLLKARSALSCCGIVSQ